MALFSKAVLCMVILATVHGFFLSDRKDESTTVANVVVQQTTSNHDVTVIEVDNNNKGGKKKDGKTKVDAAKKGGKKKHGGTHTATGGKLDDILSAAGKLAGQIPCMIQVEAECAAATSTGSYKSMLVCCFNGMAMSTTISVKKGIPIFICLCKPSIPNPLTGGKTGLKIPISLKGGKTGVKIPVSLKGGKTGIVKPSVASATSVPWKLPGVNPFQQAQQQAAAIQKHNMQVLHDNMMKSRGYWGTGAITVIGRRGLDEE